jgi:hypothetical protein
MSPDFGCRTTIVENRKRREMLSLCALVIALALLGSIEARRSQRAKKGP